MSRNKKRRLEQRRIAIIKRLCDLSRNSWRNATRQDYQPLERELEQINRELSEHQNWRMHP